MPPRIVFRELSRRCDVVVCKPPVYCTLSLPFRAFFSFERIFFLLADETFSCVAFSPLMMFVSKRSRCPLFHSSNSIIFSCRSGCFFFFVPLPSLPLIRTRKKKGVPLSVPSQGFFPSFCEERPQRRRQPCDACSSPPPLPFKTLFPSSSGGIS